MMDGDSGGTTVRVKKFGVHLGAEISGVDLTQTLSDADIAAIRAALLEHQVLVFRDQDITPRQQMAFGARFGELSVHPIAPHDEEIPELIVFDNTPENPAVFTDNWHSDETFRATPPLGTLLRAIQVPEIGGDTLFCSMTAAYEGLSDRIKHLIDGLEAVHDVKLFRLGFTDDEAGREQEKYINENFPKVIHPVVREHPETGQKVLFVNPHFTLHIKGMSEIESQSLLTILYHQAEIPEYQIRHKWEPNTMLFWDNRSTQHYAPHDYTERRFLHRITIVGDRPYAPGQKPS